MNNRILTVLVFLLAGACGWLFYKSMQIADIAYVRSADLIYEYAGMKEAQKSYEEKAKQWQNSIDTLQYDFQKAVNTYNEEMGKLSEKERQRREGFLSQQRQNLSVYSQNLNEKAKEEERKMTDGVLNQINSFVEEYAKKKGYELVLGTTASGNVLYGEKHIDITDEILKELNNNYSTKAEIKSE